MPIFMKEIIQGSPEWFQEKLAKPSASNGSKIITTLGKPSKSREGYIHTLAAEKITGIQEEGFKSDAMQAGNNREEESRKLFELISGEEVEEVGVIYKDNDKKFLCSPDGIIKGKKEGLELKNVLPKTQVKYLLKGVVPSEYIVQIQFSLYVTGYEFWNFFTYSPGLPPLLIKVPRNEPLIEALSIELELFDIELKEIVNKLK